MASLLHLPFPPTTTMIRSYPHPRYPTHNAPLQLDAGDHREVSHRCPSMLECTHLIRALSFVQVAAVCEAWARADHGVEEEATYSSERSPFFFGFHFRFHSLGATRIYPAINTPAGRALARRKRWVWRLSAVGSDPSSSVLSFLRNVFVRARSPHPGSVGTSECVDGATR